MNEKPVFSNKLQRWMAKPICHKKYFYLDKWSFVHFTSGLILGFIFTRYFSTSYAWLIVLIILVAYEFFEFSVSKYLFRREIPFDKIWDIIIGMAGFLIIWL
jgi:hypothetical protein